MAQNIFQLIVAATGNMISSLMSGSRSRGATNAFQARIAGTGTFGCTVSIYGNTFNDTSGVLLGTLSLSNTLLNDGISIPSDWPFYYAVISGSNGTITSINLYVANN